MSAGMFSLMFYGVLEVVRLSKVRVLYIHMYIYYDTYVFLMFYDVMSKM